jgi:hypothetical protein
MSNAVNETMSCMTLVKIRKGSKGNLITSNGWTGFRFRKSTILPYQFKPMA